MVESAKKVIKRDRLIRFTLETDVRAKTYCLQKDIGNYSEFVEKAVIEHLNKVEDDIDGDSL